MVVAKTDEAHEALWRCSGGTRSSGATSRSSAARWTTRRSRWTRRWAGAPRGSSWTASGGRPAETRFEVLERAGSTSRCSRPRPRTGRTHQIRVHLSSIGHPILGDRVYGGAGDDARRLGLTRPFLHSWRIAFAHPIDG